MYMPNTGLGLMKKNRNCHSETQSKPALSLVEGNLINVSATTPHLKLTPQPRNVGARSLHHRYSLYDVEARFIGPRPPPLLPHMSSITREGLRL